MTSKNIFESIVRWKAWQLGILGYSVLYSFTYWVPGKENISKQSRKYNSPPGEEKCYSRLESCIFTYSIETIESYLQIFK